MQSNQSVDPSITTEQDEVIESMTKRFCRPPATKHQVHAIIARRYGSLTDFSRITARVSQIAKALGFNWMTVKSIIKRFHANGNQFLPRPRPIRPRKVPARVEEELISRELLNEMRFLPLAARCQIVRERYQLAISVTCLAKLYKRNKVKYRPAKTTIRVSE